MGAIANIKLIKQGGVDGAVGLIQMVGMIGMVVPPPYGAALTAITSVSALLCRFPPPLAPPYVLCLTAPCPWACRPPPTGHRWSPPTLWLLIDLRADIPHCHRHCISREDCHEGRDARATR